MKKKRVTKEAFIDKAESLNIHITPERLDSMIEAGLVIWEKETITEAKAEEILNKVFYAKKKYQ